MINLQIAKTRYKYVIMLVLLICFKQISSQSLNNQELKDSIEILLKKNKIPGAFVTVVNKDSVLFKSGIGFSDLKNKSRVTNQHLFGLGSVAKTFTSMAIVKLINEGKLSLEDKLSDIAPKIPFENKWETTHPIKLKHLLTHRTGFDDMHIASLIKKRTANMTALDEALTFKNSYKSFWQPGLVFSYSNPSYAILGYIIEKISGQKYQDYIKENILLPLAMKDTRYFSTNADTTKFVTGHSIINDKIKKVDYPKFIGESGGGILSNANDMSNFLQYFLNEKLQDSLSLINKKGIHLMEALHSKYEIENNIKSGYSLGLGNRQFGEPEQNFKGHSGAINGFITNFIYNREKNIGIAVCINKFGSGNGAIVDLLVNNFSNKEIKKHYAFTEESIDKFKNYEGYYRIQNDENLIFNFINYPVRVKKIRIKNNELLISEIGDGIETYKHVGNNAFKADNETLPTVYLTTANGKKSVSYDDSVMLKTNGLYYNIFVSFLIFSLIISVVTIVLFIIQLILFSFKKKIKKVLPLTFFIILPFLLIVISSFLVINNYALLDLEKIGKLSITSTSIFITTLIYPFLGIFAIYSLLKKVKVINKKWIRCFYTIALLSTLYISIYAFSLGWFALRLWCY